MVSQAVYQGVLRWFKFWPSEDAAIVALTLYLVASLAVIAMTIKTRTWFPSVLFLQFSPYLDPGLHRSCRRKILQSKTRMPRAASSQCASGYVQVYADRCCCWLDGDGGLCVPHRHVSHTFHQTCHLRNVTQWLLRHPGVLRLTSPLCACRFRKPQYGTYVAMQVCYQAPLLFILLYATHLGQTLTFHCPAVFAHHSAVVHRDPSGKPLSRLRAHQPCEFVLCRPLHCCALPAGPAPTLKSQP